MVLNNVTKFHKIQIVAIRLRKWTSKGVMCEQTDRLTDRGNT